MMGYTRTINVKMSNGQTVKYENIPVNGFDIILVYELEQIKLAVEQSANKSQEGSKGLRQDIQGLTEALNRFTNLYANVNKSIVESQPEIKGELYYDMPIEDLDIGTNAYNAVKRRGVNSVGELVSHTREELNTKYRHYKINPGSIAEGELVSAINKLGLRFKGDTDKQIEDIIQRAETHKNRKLQRNTAVVSDDTEADDAIIADALQKLGYEAWDLKNQGLSWAMEAIRFAMNNSHLRQKLRIYVWQPIADKHERTYQEIKEIVSQSVKQLKSTWPPEAEKIIGGRDTNWHAILYNIGEYAGKIKRREITL
jgi:hypothetical protein